jgi:hypothetical protein
VRFFEIAGAQRRVLATKRFIKNAKAWIKLYPDVGQTLADFLRFRETAPANQGFSKKDAPFTGGVLKGAYRHVHFRFGKVICVYALGTNEIRLIDMVDHDTMDSDAFARFVTSVGSSDFQSFGGEDEPSGPALVPGYADELRDLLYGFAGHPQDRMLLIQTYEGKYVDDVWDMLRSVVSGDGSDAQKDKLILNVYGGLKGFRAAVEAILRQTQ